MCGISGILNHKSQNKNIIFDLLNKINSNLSHRGPDNTGTWNDNKNFCFLGHTRLSILDLSINGNQPMLDQDKRYVISFNGEIYNFKELREALKQSGVKFKTNTDTEVLLEGYKLFGKSFIQHLDGMFACAIYEIENNKLLIFRDRAGEKPIYYIDNSDFFVFSSEFKPLLNLKKLINFSISKKSLFDFFAFRYSTKQKTMFKEISKLEPGCFIEISKTQSLSIKRYFSFNVYPEDIADKKQSHDLIDKVHYTIKKSVYNRLNSDVPLGMFLSGGIDSSLTSSIVTKVFNRNLNTFSIGFENYKKSEHNISRKISEQIGSTHNEIIVNNSDIEKIFSNIGNIMDELNGDRSLIPTYIVSKFAKEKVTVVLSGDGADELFGGYPRHWALMKFYNERYTDYIPEKIFETYISNLLPYYNLSQLKVVDTEVYNELIQDHSNHYLHDYRSLSSSTRELDYYNYLQIVLSKVDIASMKNSLEVRTPFLNNELINIASQIPEKLLYNGKFSKLILRIILDNYVSSDITTLPKKGFGLPTQNYDFFNNNNLKFYNESLETLKGIAFFKLNPSLTDFIAKNSFENSNSLWGIFAMAKWFESLDLNL